MHTLSPVDFMASLGLEAWHVDLASPEEDIFERALARAQERQRGLRDYARRLLEVPSPSGRGPG